MQRSFWTLVILTLATSLPSRLTSSSPRSKAPWSAPTFRTTKSHFGSATRTFPIRFAGSGIGLYVVRELARLHGGDTWIEDAPNKGARVVIELNAAPRAAGFTDEHRVDGWTGGQVDRSIAAAHPSTRPPVHP